MAGFGERVARLQPLCLAEQAAAAINSCLLFEQSQEDALIDPLTGLPNARFLRMHVTRELERAERLSTEVGFLLIDLDNSREIKDAFSHHVADRALCEVARVLRQSIRPYDICARWDRDEFIIVLTGSSPDDTDVKLREVRRAIDQVFFEGRPGQRVPLGVGIGAAVFPSDGSNYEALFATADNRLRLDKKARKRGQPFLWDV